MTTPTTPPDTIRVEWKMHPKQDEMQLFINGRLDGIKAFPYDLGVPGKVEDFIAVCQAYAMNVVVNAQSAHRLDQAKKQAAKALAENPLPPRLDVPYLSRPDRGRE